MNRKRPISPEIVLGAAALVGCGMVYLIFSGVWNFIQWVFGG